MEDKDASFEVLCVCESSSQPWPINFYNPLTGAAVWSYKGVEMNDDEPQDAILVGNDYLLIPTVKKPLVLQVGFESKVCC
uniref:Uncharacterized protein n=1 Tax=Romanomermis culicivorax TaxID=13658 RepID=A0A915KEM2_ROMCU